MIILTPEELDTEGRFGLRAQRSRLSHRVILASPLAQECSFRVGLSFLQNRVVRSDASGIGPDLRSDSTWQPSGTCRTRRRDCVGPPALLRVQSVANVDI